MVSIIGVPVINKLYVQTWMSACQRIQVFTSSTMTTGPTVDVSQVGDRALL